jgi:hypothetical protein
MIAILETGIYKRLRIRFAVWVLTKAPVPGIGIL